MRSFKSLSLAFFFIGQSNLPHCALFQIFLLLCSFVFYLCKNMFSKILGSPIKGGKFRLAVDKCFFKPAVKQYCVSSRLSNIVFQVTKFFICFSNRTFLLEQAMMSLQEMAVLNGFNVIYCFVKFLRFCSIIDSK